MPNFAAEVKPDYCLDRSKLGEESIMLMVSQVTIFGCSWNKTNFFDNNKLQQFNLLDPNKGDLHVLHNLDYNEADEFQKFLNTKPPRYPKGREVTIDKIDTTDAASTLKREKDLTGAPKTKTCGSGGKRGSGHISNIRRPHLFEGTGASSGTLHKGVDFLLSESGDDSDGYQSLSDGDTSGSEELNGCTASMVSDINAEVHNKYDPKLKVKENDAVIGALGHEDIVGEGIGGQGDSLPEVCEELAGNPTIGAQAACGLPKDSVEDSHDGSKRKRTEIGDDELLGASRKKLQTVREIGESSKRSGIRRFKKFKCSKKQQGKRPMCEMSIIYSDSDSNDEVANLCTGKQRRGYGYLCKRGPKSFTVDSMTDDDFSKLKKYSWVKMVRRSQKFAAKNQCHYTGLIAKGEAFRRENMLLRKDLASQEKYKKNIVESLQNVENDKKQIFGELHVQKNRTKLANFERNKLLCELELLRKERDDLVVGVDNAVAESVKLGVALKKMEDRALDAEAHLDGRPSEENDVLKYKHSEEYKKSIEDAGRLYDKKVVNGRVGTTEAWRRSLEEKTRRELKDAKRNKRTAKHRKKKYLYKKKRLENVYGAAHVLATTAGGDQSATSEDDKDVKMTNKVETNGCVIGVLETHAPVVADEERNSSVVDMEKHDLLVVEEDYHDSVAVHENVDSIVLEETYRVPSIPEKDSGLAVGGDKEHVSSIFSASDQVIGEVEKLNLTTLEECESLAGEGKVHDSRVLEVECEMVVDEDKISDPQVLGKQCEPVVGDEKNLTPPDFDVDGDIAADSDDDGNDSPLL